MPKTTSRIYYHGTSQLEWETIQYEGLIPGKCQGGDYWAVHSPNNEVRGVLGLPKTRNPSVYLTNVIHHAEFFARMAAENNNSKPVVLAVTLSLDAHLINDEEDAGPGYRYEGTIPASQITLHHDVLGVRKATNYANPFSLFGL